jgi:hypothetical protein
MEEINKMGYSNKRYSDYLTKTRVVFDNIENLPDLKAQLLEFGYDDARIQVGADLRTNAEMFFQQHLEKRQLWRSMTATVREKLGEAYTVFASYTGWLRKELADDTQAIEVLGLTGPRERNGGRFVDQSTNFYTTAISDTVLQAKLLPFGLTLEKLQAGLGLVNAYNTVYSEYMEVKGDCQRLVVERDKAFKALKSWMAAFIAAGKIAFADNPQTLEMLGIFVRNQPRTRKSIAETPTEPQEPAQDPAQETPPETGNP